jgi:hypothetical protein
MRLEKMMRLAKKKNQKLAKKQNRRLAKKKNQRLAKKEKQKAKQKQKAWVVHPGAPGPETRKAIRTAIREAMTRQAMIAETGC